MNINLMSCRVCLKEKKAKKLRSIFGHKFEDSDLESIAEYIYYITGVKIDHSETSTLPTKICRNCFENLLIAKNVRKQVIDSDKYLKDLLAQGATPYIPDQDEDLLNVSTENPVKLEKLEDESTNKEQLLNYEDICGLFSENESNIMPDTGDHYANDSSNYNVTDRLKSMGNLGEIKKEISEEIEVKVSLNEMIEMTDIMGDPDCSKSKKSSKKLRYKSQDTTVHQCLVCGKVYKNKYILKAHEARHYPQPAPTVKYTCDMCNREFTKKVNIYRHMQGVHFKEKKFKCQFCGKQFYNSVDFKTHVNDHQNIKEWPCMECPMRFGRKRYLEIHMRKHSGERPYQCKYCERAFSHHSDHRRHEMMHTGERPYKCSICGRGFVRRCHMLSHEKIHR